jgi:glycerol-3-phosphate dehydrogenase (NAD(P)+)
MGLLLANGKTISAAQDEIGQVVEGIRAAKAVKKVAQDHRVIMPICDEIYRILYDNVPPHEAVSTLMGRALKPE